MMDLSMAEQCMFAELGQSELFTQPISIMSLYRVAVEECFMADVRGKAADSLRRCLRAIYNGTDRRTKEFDDLIVLS